jgi:hypothetical protein
MMQGQGKTRDQPNVLASSRAFACKRIPALLEVCCGGRHDSRNQGQWTRCEMAWFMLCTKVGEKYDR